MIGNIKFKNLININKLILYKYFKIYSKIKISEYGKQ